MRGRFALSGTVRPEFGIVLCAAVNYLVAYAIFSSSYGSAFFMSDDERSSIVWVPLLVGAVVGCVESLSFSVRIAAVASIVSVLGGIAAFLMLGTLILGAIGGAAGCVAAWAYLRLGPHLVSIPCLILGAISVAAATTVIVIAATPGYEDLDRVHTPPGGPAVLVQVDGDPYQPSITGRLTNVDGCVGITNATPVPAPGDAPRSVIEDSAAGEAVVIWPHGTTVASDPFSVTSRGRTYQLGDEVAVGGGWVHLIKDDPFYDQTPKACLAKIFIY